MTRSNARLMSWAPFLRHVQPAAAASILSDAIIIRDNLRAKSSLLSQLFGIADQPYYTSPAPVHQTTTYTV